LEEAYMRMTQGAVDYRSTVDQKAGLQQPLPPGAQPPMPVPGQGQPGWYAPPPPQQGGQPFAMPQGQPGPQGPYGAPPAPAGAPGAGVPNPYAQQAPQPPQQAPAPHPAPSAPTKPEDAR
jgi:ABC-2 type transport system ATP-binding protein